MSLFSVTFIALWLAILGGVLVSWFMSFRVHYQLRAKNAALWSQLGSPSVLRSGARLRRFQGRESGRIEDKTLTALLRTKARVHIGVGLAVIAFLMLVLLHKWS
jgi:hypothetical protein